MMGLLMCRRFRGRDADQSSGDEISVQRLWI